MTGVSQDAATAKMIKNIFKIKNIWLQDGLLVSRPVLLSMLFLAVLAFFMILDVSFIKEKQPIKIGILHSLAGNMAASEKSLVVAAWRYPPEPNPEMVVKKDTDEAFAPVYDQRKNLVKILLAVIVAGAFIAFYFARQIVMRIQNITQIADEIAEGDLSKRVDDSGTDEVGKLGNAFNRMARKLQLLYQTIEYRVEERTNELNAINEQLLQEIQEREKMENALKESEYRWKFAIEGSGDGLWDWNIAENTVFYSKRWKEMFGYTEEAIGAGRDEWEKRIHPDDKIEVMETLKEYLDDLTPLYLCEHRLICEDGSIKWVLDRGMIVSRSQNGKPLRMIGTHVNITDRKKNQIALERNQDQLNEAERLGHLGSWELDLLNNELRWSEEIYRIFELDPQQFKPSYEKFLSVIHPDDRDKVNQAYTQSLQDQQPYDIAHRLVFPDGRVKWVREHCVSYFDNAGKALRSVGAVQDITAQKIAEEGLRIAGVTFETHEAILITDANAKIIRVNRAFTEITGYTLEEVIGKNPRILRSGKHDKIFYQEMWQKILTSGAWTGEIWDRRKSGQIYPKWLTITAVKNDDNEITEFIAIFSDITARKDAENEIRNLAYYDPLTGLPNRRLFLDRFNLSLSASDRSRNYGAVVFLDMDKFKSLNDTMGHSYGDLLLIEVSRRIKYCLREMDTVARFGGDEFVALIEEMDQNAEAASQKASLIAEKIRAALSAPYHLNDFEHHSSPSIGVCMFQGSTEPAGDLLKRADMAMYQAKDSGRNAVRFFDPHMQQVVELHASLENDLRKSISEGQLNLYYQIQVDSKYHPVGAEALLRWKHPVRGFIPPGQFIPVAEESSLILELGEWVLENACRQLAVWSQNEKTRSLVLSVNVSAKQLRMDDFVEKVSSIIKYHQVEASRLKIEFTESVVMDNISDTIKKMRALKELNIRLSMDDFGTGYSSLSQLKQLPLDQLKIDQSFVRDIATDPGDAVMVQTIINMAQNFNLDIIAEGVETQEQLDFLREHGCLTYQGYFFGKPVPLEDFEKLLG